MKIYLVTYYQKTAKRLKPNVKKYLINIIKHSFIKIKGQGQWIQNLKKYLKNT